MIEREAGSRSCNSTESAPNAPAHHISCAGMSHIGIRRLSAGEAEALGKKACSLHSSWRRAFTLFLVSAALSVVSFALLSHAPILASDLPLMVLLVVFLGTLAAAPSYYFVSRNRRRHAKLLRQTYTAGYVRVFAGPDFPDDPSNEDYGLLLSQKVLDPARAGQHRLELHPNADKMYAADDVVLGQPLSARVCTAVAPPTAPSLFAAPSEWVPPAASGDLKGRRMSPEEHHELSLYLKTLRKKSFRPFFFLSFAPLIAAALNGRPFSGQTAMLIAIAVLLIPALRSFRQHRRQDRDLKGDADNGCLIVSPAHRDPHAAPGEDDLVPQAEYLPASGVLWTFGGYPAAWRDTAGL